MRRRTLLEIFWSAIDNLRSNQLDEKADRKYFMAYCENAYCSENIEYLLTDDQATICENMARSLDSKKDEYPNPTLNDDQEEILERIFPKFK